MNSYWRQSCQPYWSNWYQVSPADKICETIISRHRTTDHPRPGSPRGGTRIMWAPQFPWLPARRQLPTMVHSLANSMNLGGRHQNLGQLTWLRFVGHRLVSDKRKRCKEDTPESMLKSLANLWLRAGLFICRAKPPDDDQIANETGLNMAERPSSEGRSVLGTLGFWLCQSGETSWTPH